MVDSNPDKDRLLAGVRVLVLDDERVIRDLASYALQDEGAEVYSAADGWQGLQELFDHSASVLVVDVHMPKMDGIAFLQEALKIWPWMGVVVITGYDPTELFSSLIKLGVTTVLQKPFSTAELVECVVEEYQRVQDASVQEQRIPLQRIQQQLQILRMISKPALEADTLVDALRGSADALSRAMDFAVIGVCGRESEQTAAIFNVQGDISQRFIDELKHFMVDRYLAFAGTEPSDGFRIELTGRQLNDYGHNQLGSTYCVPIMNQADLQGFLVLASAGEANYDAAEISFIYTIANHLSTIFAALDRMRNMAIMDPLTGLCNRLHFEAEVTRIWSWSKRNEYSLTLLMVDLDHFKQVNDTYGHQAGDRVLKEFAALLEGTGRVSDVTGRYGGEEFVVVLTEADHESAMIYANRLLSRTRNYIFCKGDLDLHLTVSVGLSVAAGDKLERMTVQEVIDEADRAMYVAKRAGRNCVRTWNEVKSRELKGTSSVSKKRNEFGEETLIGTPLSKGSILLVDDEKTIRKLLREMLTLEHYNVSEAEDGQQALDMVESDPSQFDLVITDIQMPNMNGLDLIKRVKSLDDTIICIIISGHASLENAVASMRKGAYDFIQKPFSQVRQVMGTVYRAMEYRRALMENRQYQRHLSDMVREKSTKAREALEEVAQSYSFTLEALMGLLDARERGTGIHSKRVRAMVLRLAKDFQMDNDQYEAVGYGALLHDIGKIGIPDRILLKPGSLTRDEQKIMRSHVEIGHRILSGSGYLRDVAEIVIAHHETYDGSGYPKGLAGDEIPLGARLFAVVDAYDAMRADRVYRKGMPEDAAILEIIKKRGTQFDPVVVDIFLECRQEIGEIYDDWENSGALLLDESADSPHLTVN